MKVKISLLVLLFAHRVVFSQGDTIPKNERTEFRIASRLLVGWWCFESKKCVHRTDTTTETSTYGSSDPSKRPHTYLEFKRNGELFVYAEKYPQFSRMRKKPLIAYVAAWRIERRAFDKSYKPYLNIHWKSAGTIECEFTGFISIDQNKIVIANIEDCLVELKKHSGKF